MTGVALATTGPVGVPEECLRVIGVVTRICVLLGLFKSDRIVLLLNWLFMTDSANY